jgi:hypothetical protein
VHDVEITLRPYDTVGHAVAVRAMYDNCKTNHDAR